MQTVDTNSRSIAKAVSYRILGSASTGLIFYTFTGQATLSIGAGLMDMVVKIGVYYVHERIWAHLHFGRPKPPEYEI